MQLTSYDHDLLRELRACNFDLGQVAFNRYLRREQVLWWTQQPHIAQAIIELQAQAASGTGVPACVQPPATQQNTAPMPPAAHHYPSNHRSSAMRRHRVRPLLLRLSATLLLAATATAGPPPELREAREQMNDLVPGSVRAKVPSTTAGKQFQWMLEALNNVDVTGAEERCSKSFLDFISISELEGTLREIKEEVYEGKEVVPLRVSTSDRDDIIDAIITGVGMPNALSVLLITDDKTGKIASLRFAPAGGNNPGGAGGGGEWDPMSKDADRMDGTVSYGVYEIQPRDPKEPNGPLELLPISGQDEHRALNIGNTVRLYVLNALVDQIESSRATDKVVGSINWDTRITIADNLKSLPSGRMQLETAGRSYPVRRFAELMMTADDNTAIDHIVTLLGRDVVETSVNARNDNAALNTPFLLTREAFALKLVPDGRVAQDYIDAEDADQRTMLTEGELAKAKPDVEQLGAWKQSPQVAEIGWFASAEQLCELMKRMRELEVQRDTMLISPWIRATTGIGLDPQVWKSAAYVGASEPGVMSGVWLLERQDAKMYAVSVIWNSKSETEDQDSFNALAERATEILAKDFKVEDEEESVMPIRSGKEPADESPPQKEDE